MDDHPLRYALVNELHARPAAKVTVPSTVAVLAIKMPQNAAARDRAVDRAHMVDLLDRHGGTHPAPGATHHASPLGRHSLKWESHTEFLTYMAITPGRSQRPFDPRGFDVFPADWLDSAPGVRVTSILIEIQHMPMSGGAMDGAAITAMLEDWFVPESLAAATVIDGAAIVASDFRIDAAGHLRMAIFADPAVGAQRLGRILQRLTEIETYKSMSMLGLARARGISAEMGALDQRLSALVGDMAANPPNPDQSLGALMTVSAELEKLAMTTSFRFGATRAYEALVHARIQVLREARFQGRQTLTEFMQRRFDPAMRTVRAAEARLELLSERAMRAGTLLSTQVEVARSAQNQTLLASMDQRADLQLRLQTTVEGLSVVAISYYAVGLASNLMLPLAEPLGWGKAGVMAVLTPVIVGAVWLAVRRIRNRLH